MTTTLHLARPLGYGARRGHTLHAALVSEGTWYSGMTSHSPCGTRVDVAEATIELSDPLLCRNCAVAAPRALLLAHIHAAHRRQPAETMPLSELARWHANEHYRYSPNHHHGPTRGPSDRPPGWYDGTGAVALRGRRP